MSTRWPDAWRASVVAVSVICFAGGIEIATAATLPGGSGWSANARAFVSSMGQQYSYTCPPHGTASAVWGTGTYTSDSSVCTAAVSAGLITLAKGGTVIIKISPGKPSYNGSTRNGVTTDSYGSWSASYVFEQPAAAPTPHGAVAVGGSGWSATAVALRGKNGQFFAFVCPPGGKAGPVYGTSVYTDNSSVCTAAVHAGLIQLTTGGRVTVEIVAGKYAYAGSSSHGVTSLGVGSPGSFQFVK